MIQTITDIGNAFSFLDDWEDRYRYIIELGYQLKPYPQSARDDAHRISGCVSQVWLVSHHESEEEEEDPVLTFKGDADAHLVKGLLYIILVLYSGKRASEILAIDAASLLKSLGLDQYLTSQRLTGLTSLITQIRRQAAKSYLRS
ncbi:MAG: cysteine desulfuration protein SufE [Candidatus Tokpelaia sp. JSC085]|nr:MAG: cysteine desulfuration protein SufE [Candidatus Tokpelaia sp. JSC085]